MSFTYENNTLQTTLETYEWDNTWLEQASRRDVPRVLYVGDSISCGIRKIATEQAGGAFLFDGFGTSKALDNPYFLPALRLFAAQQSRCDVILFNNGLHGWHLKEEEYGRLYGEAVRCLLQEFPGVSLYCVLSTSTDNEARAARVAARNEAVLAVAEHYGLPVIDLHTVSVQYAHLRTDGVHFSKEGYAALSRCILSALKSVAQKGEQ